MKATITFSDLLDFTDYIKVDGLMVDTRVEVSLIRDEVGSTRVLSMDVKDIFIITESEQSLKVQIDRDAPFYRKLLATLESRAITQADDTEDKFWSRV